MKHVQFWYQFHAVGQGLFASGHLREHEHNRQFHWVFDCGTSSRRAYVQREIARFKHVSGAYADNYFRFITTPGVQPTNNLAEQAIRFVAIHRRITYGTRGEAGQRWCERIWTAIATCGQQGRSVFEFVHRSVEAHLSGGRPPTLLPNTS